MKDQQTGKKCANAPDKANAHILVADDAPISLAVLRKALSKSYVVLEANNGRQALEILRRGGVSLVLSDILMPEMSGLELLKAIEEDPALAHTPVMMITADGNTENEIEALRLGAVDVIRKPVVPQILLARIRNLLALQTSLLTAEENLKNQQRLIAQAETLRRAEQDELTGVLTRQAFYRHVRAYLDAHPGQQLELLRFDLDHFSSVNDVMGVKAGDRLLSELGHRLRSYSGHTTDIPVVGHIEADHFAALHDPSGQSAEELFRYLQSWLTTQEAEYHMNCRLGVYPITDPTVDPTVMCDRALQALRSTKGSFTNRLARYDASMRQKRMEEQTLTDEMLPALHNGQFVIYYQPQVNYSTGELIGAEALVRWNHPRKGLLPPAVFLPLFEHSGQITQLDNYVWENVCRQLKSWREKPGGRIVPVSVNISRVDTYGEDLTARLTALTEKYEIPRELLRLKITESAYMGDAQRLCQTVRRLSAEGFTIEMDDFGSAYSSLNMLKDIAVDILKLDMKFLSDTENSARSGNILSSVVRMARWLKLPVIAEGVETQQQADYLCSIGCLYMQGYYFSKPLPAEEYKAFFHTHPLGKPDKYRNTDISAAEKFWDASTQTALIFNSYVGGAVILQRTGEKLELLRANDEFFRVVHISRENYMPFLLDIWRRFAPGNEAVYRTMLDRASRGDEKAACDICSVSPTGGAGRWTRNRARLLAKNGDSEIFYVLVEDVTEEKYAQEELARQKNLLTKLYNGVPCGILDYLVRDGKVQLDDFNDTAWKLTGYASRQAFAQEHRGKTECFGVHPDDQPILREKTRETLEQGSCTTMEGRVVRADHSCFWAEIRLQRYVERENITLQSVFMDISARREQETQKYTRVLLSIFDEAFLWDYQADTTRTLKGTPPYSETGETIAGLLGQQKRWVSAYVVPEDRERLLHFVEPGQLRAACAHREIPSIEYGVILPDKRRAVARASVFSVEENQFLFCCKEITQEKKAARQEAKEIAVLQATLEDRERYRMIVEQAGAAVIDWNHSTGEFFHSGTYENYEMSRCKPAAVIQSQGAAALAYPEDVPAFENFFRDGRSGKPGAEAVLRLKMTDGSYRWTRMRGRFLFDAAGSLIRTIGTFTDADDEIRAKEKLQETNTRLENIIANIPSGVGIYRIETSGDVIPLYVSDRACQMFGFTREEYDARIAAGVPVNFIADLGGLQRSQMDAARNGEPISIQRIHARRKDGSQFWLRLNCSFMAQPPESTVCYATLMDVSNLVAAEQAADSVRELYQLLIESTETITFDYSIFADLLRLSFMGPERTRVEKLYPNYEARLRKGESYVAVHSRPELLRSLRSAARREVHGELDIQAEGPDNAEHWYHIKFLSLSEEGTVYRIIGRADNFDGVVRSQEVKLEQAQIDRVTGLRSKDAGRAAVEALMRQRPEGQSDAMLFLDIDDFKGINDTVGHLEADRVLARVGAVLKKSFRPVDITARFGGDEFLIYIVAPGNRTAILNRAGQLLEAVRLIRVDETRNLECSIGIAEVTGDLRSFDAAFHCADQAMYAAKRSGKNRVSDCAPGAQETLADGEKPIP